VEEKESIQGKKLCKPKRIIIKNLCTGTVSQRIKKKKNY
jgi:hypothetical protein